MFKIISRTFAAFLIFGLSGDPAAAFVFSPSASLPNQQGKVQTNRAKAYNHFCEEALTLNLLESQFPQEFNPRSRTRRIRETPIRRYGRAAIGGDAATISLRFGDFSFIEPIAFGDLFSSWWTRVRRLFGVVRARQYSDERSFEQTEPVALQYLRAFGLERRESLTSCVQSRRRGRTGLGEEFEVDRIRIPKRPTLDPVTGLPTGLSLLRYEMGPTDTFDLVYREGRLIQIRAVRPPKSSALDDRTTPLFAAVSLVELYFDIPQPGTRDAQKRWAAFLDDYHADWRAIEASLPRGEPFGTRVRFERAFVYFDIDVRSGRVSFEAFSPLDLLSDWRQRRRFTRRAFGHRRIILHRLSGVYDPFSGSEFLWQINLRHYLHLYGITSRLYERMTPAEKVNAKTLVVGPGLGMDAFTVGVSAGGGEISTISLSEPENVAGHLLGKAAGLRIRGKTHDNIVSPRGQLAFPGDRFKIITWFMPQTFAETEAPAESEHTIGLERHWYGDRESKLLRQFVANVASVLEESEDARVIIGNRMGPADPQQNPIMRAFSDAGFELAQEGSFTEDGFYVFKRRGAPSIALLNANRAPIAPPAEDTSAKRLPPIPPPTFSPERAGFRQDALRRSA